jgi:hypothetical protein
LARSNVAKRACEYDSSFRSARFRRRHREAICHVRRRPAAQEMDNQAQ